MYRWVTVGTGDRLDTGLETEPGRQLPNGTPIKFKMELRLPLSRAFDLPGAEVVLRAVMPEGTELKDVYGEVIDGRHYGIVDAVVKTNPAPVAVAKILAWVGKHWVALTIGMLLGWLVISFDLDAWLPFFRDIVMISWIAIAIIVIVVVFIIVRAGVTAPGIKIGR